MGSTVEIMCLIVIFCDDRLSVKIANKMNGETADRDLAVEFVMHVF